MILQAMRIKLPPLAPRGVDDAVTNDSLLPGRICRRIIWGNRRGGDGWEVLRDAGRQLRSFHRA